MLPIISYYKVLQGCLEVIFNYALLTPASTLPARFDEMLRESEERMYADKAQYYKEKGVERRKGRA